LVISDGKSKRLDRDFKITGLIMLPVAVGIALFGLILGTQVPKAQLPLLGSAALVACIGLGFLGVSKIVERWYSTDEKSASDYL